jgi:DNA-binding IclR family transcriptional regulator
MKRGSAERYRIQAIDRAAAILNCFEAGRPELNVRDIAEQTGLHKSTAHRILMALQHNGLVEQDTRSGRYHLGLQLVKLGEHAVQRLDVRVVARPFLEELAQATREIAHLAVLDGEQVVTLDRVDLPSAIGSPMLPGRLFPAYATSMGKAMLAALDEAEVRRLLGRGALKRHTPKTLVSVDALLDELKSVRRRGYATTDEELAVGLCTVGAAIQDHSGAVVAALSVSGPSARIRSAPFSALGERVKAAAAAVSRQLGFGRVGLPTAARSGR